MTTASDLEKVVQRGFSDITQFAEHIVGEPLWPHQIDCATSPARYRIICAGRQVGKSRLLAIEALWRAYTQPGALVLLISAGETAALRLLEECASLATSSPLLAGAVVGDAKTQLTLANGSRIISVPASQRQIRGWSVDLLICDEAGFVDNDIWRAAEPAIIARPGSRVILSSSPWGSQTEDFFGRLWRQGTDQPNDDVASWHWPSSMSPMISDDDLAKIRDRESPAYFEREYEAKWTEAAGSYFTEAEISAAVAPYTMVPPEDQRYRPDGSGLVVGGIDWGFANDSSAVVLLGALSDINLNRALSGERSVWYIAWAEAASRVPYGQFIDRLAEIACGYEVYRYISEENGVGAMPTQVLRERLDSASSYYDMHGRYVNLGDVRRPVRVKGVHTSLQRKSSAFGKLKGMLQLGRLVLPNEPHLLRELRGLTYEQTPTGHMKISVPEALGHDDLVMALMQAVSAISLNRYPWAESIPGEGELLSCPNGVRISELPRTHPDESLLRFIDPDKP